MSNTEDDRPDAVPHQRYTVVFTYLDGSTKSVRVLTNRGHAKAIHLASSGGRGLLTGPALDVRVVDDGPPEVDEDGVPVLRGYASDRNEW